MIRTDGYGVCKKIVLCFLVLYGLSPRIEGTRAEYDAIYLTFVVPAYSYGHGSVVPLLRFILPGLITDTATFVA